MNVLVIGCGKVGYYLARTLREHGHHPTVIETDRQRAKRSANELDMVVYCGSEYKDYYLFNCAAAIQHGIGASNAAVFEIHNLCSAGVWGLKVLKSMMIQDPELKHVLLVSSSKEGDLIN